jgi:hypothetical protein
LRYRDLVFSTVSTTTNVTYGSAMNNSGQTVTLQFDSYEPTGDTVTERPAIVWVHGGSFRCGDKSFRGDRRRSNHLRQRLFQRLDQLSTDRRLFGWWVTPTCLTAIQKYATTPKCRSPPKTNAAVTASTPRIATVASPAITALNVGFTSSEDPPLRWPGAALSAQIISGGTRGTGDAPSMLSTRTADTRSAPEGEHVESGERRRLRSFPRAGRRRPYSYAQHRTEILDQRTSVLGVDLKTAAQ